MVIYLKNLKVLKYIKQNLRFLVLLIFISLISCSSLAKFFPSDHFYYPVIANGYNDDIILIISYSDSSIDSGKLPSGKRIWERKEGLRIITIKIYDTNNNLLKEYSETYLNIEREKYLTDKEFWVAYKDGLVLVPEEFRADGEWQKYIDSL